MPQPRTDDPHAQAIRAAIAHLNQQYAGAPFPADAKERWNDLNRQLDELGSARPAAARTECGRKRRGHHRSVPGTSGGRTDRHP